MSPSLLELLDLVGRVANGAALARRAIAFWGPVLHGPTLVAPLFALGSLIALALLSGIAASSLAMLLVAALALYLLLTEVFGFTIELAGV